MAVRVPLIEQSVECPYPIRLAVIAIRSSDLSTSAPGISGIPFKGVFFSTFFGVHETSWAPKKEVHAYFLG